MITKNTNIIKNTEGKSMVPLMLPNDSLYIESCSFKALKIDDIVVFRSKSNLIIHRIIFKSDHYLITRGDNNYKSDGKISSKKIIGKVYRIKRNDHIMPLENIYLLQSTLYFQELVKIKTAFEKANIKYVVLKGLPLHLHFGKEHPRRIYADCDVLIKKDQFIKAKKIIEGFGYKKDGSGYRQVENNYFKLINGFPVVFDIHLEPAFLMTQFSGLGALYQQKFVDHLTSDLFDNSKLINVNHEGFFVLNSRYLVLYLLLHLFHHNFRGAFRYQFLDKVIRVTKLGSNDWSEIRLIIDKYRLANFVNPVFYLLRKYYKTPLPKDLYYDINMRFDSYSNINIFDDEPQIASGINRFLNLLKLSPNPWWIRVLVVFNPMVIGSIFLVLWKKLSSYFLNWK